MSRQPIRIEGGLFAADLLERLDRGELEGQRPDDFGLPPSTDLAAYIANVFHEARAHWLAFKQRRARLGEHASPAEVRRATRDAWLIPLLSALGYTVTRNDAGAPISHRADEDPNAPPLHLVGAHQSLDRTDEDARPRRSPHAALQMHLNQTDALWGIVTNGLRLRVLRNSAYITRQAYLEFDLEAIFEEEGLFVEFARLFRLVHRTRLPRAGADASACWLERYHQASVQQGERVRERLRDGVVQALKILGNALLRHPRNAELRAWVEQAGAGALYQQLLKLVYRLLFLLVAEERRLMGSDARYYQTYGVTRLRRLCEQRRAYTDDVDLWLGLRALWAILRDESLAAHLGAPPLNGALFEPLTIDDAVVGNRDLLTAFWHLSLFDDPPRRVNYAALDTEELGSVYESLLDFQPQITGDLSRPSTLRFDFAEGTERRTTGSYYTPPALVAELIRAALTPKVDEIRKAHADDPRAAERALLNLRVLDPACGSGHFLLAAARALGKALAQVRTGEEEPAPEQVRLAIRDVVRRCIYGVDKNPLAVELARVALWIESHAEGKPLTFLDHHIRCGDSLVGVLDLDVLRQGIPEGAYERVEGDDPTTVRQAKAENRKATQGHRLLSAALFDDAGALTQQARALAAMPDDTPEAVRHKAEQFHKIEHAAQRLRTACDLWTAAFFQPRPKDLTAAERISGLTLFAYLDTGQESRATAAATALAAQLRFFHWRLAFPEVFEAGGFDLILSNPPWERIKLQEEEFFGTRDAAIANAPNAAARKRLIAALEEKNPALWREYRRALHHAESTSRFLRGSGAYPLTGRGDINTYSVFAERIRALLHPRGRAGVVLPTGIATDATNQDFFADLVDRGQVRMLLDFENREGLFPGVHRSYKFCLLVLEGSGASQAAAKGRFAFFLTHPDQARDPRRQIALSPQDIARINPNTRTLPIFRTPQDAALTLAIYRRVPVLVDERAGKNPWRVRFATMFHMSNDAALFRTRKELHDEGYRLVGNVFVRDAARYLPLYEAKMIWHYDHRFGTYAGVRDRSSTQLPSPKDEQHDDPSFVVLPWYWVPAEEVEQRLGDWRRGWLIGFRDVTNATNERTAIFSVLPRVGVGNKIPLLLFDNSHACLLAAFLANGSALVFDFVARQKLGGTTMNFFYVKQFPFLPPEAYTAEDLRFIVPRALALAYTAWDVKPFADDVWADADDDLRAAIRALWAGRTAPTVGGAGVPLPPFGWDAARRAVLRAELDAYYARLYGLTRKQLRYILDPADLTARELEDILDPWEEIADPLQGYDERRARSDFPGETFRVLREKELREFGEYRTRRLVLEAWARLP